MNAINQIQLICLARQIDEAHSPRWLHVQVSTLLSSYSYSQVSVGVVLWMFRLKFIRLKDLHLVVEIKSSDVDTNDNDYLRMSSNQFDGNTLNYHSITPARGKQLPGDVVNHIGKPLVPTTTTRRPAIQYVYRPTDVAPRAKYQLQEAQIDGRAKTGPSLAWNATVDAGKLDQEQLLQRKQREHSGAYQPPATTRPRPRVTTARRQQSLNGFQPSPDATTTSAQQPVASSSSPAATNTCKWMQLAEFKNVSYETGRMVFVDESEQPCYILTLRAFVRWNDTLYFPLRNYQPHPRGSYKINLRYPNDGSIERLVLNCSMPELNPSARTSISLLPNQIVSGYTFDEEITILVECGYLRLKLSGDGSHVSLNSISLYQNADLDEQHWQDSDGFTTGKSKRLSKLAKSAQFATDRTIMLDARETPMMLHKHQVFSSEPVHKAPLLSMPLISRYTCRHRIVLNGSNLVQFVLERFELQRLITSQPSWSSSSSSAPNTNSYRRTNPRASSSLFITEDNHHEVDLEDPQVASRREFELAQEKVHSARLMNSGFRIRRDTTILYKSPVLAGK